MNTQIMLIAGVILFLVFVIIRQRIPTSKGNGGPVDPLAEAEVYLAYGRKKQALEMLEKALRDNPERKDIEEKLRELKGKM